MDAPLIYSVGEVTHYLKHLIEENEHLQGVQVSGEVSNLTYHRSGHVYFSIKDTEAQLSCVMFKMNAMRAPRMQAGDEVVLTGNMSIYAPRGNYQLVVQKVRKKGLGDLYQRFVELKDQLQREGLFDPSLKRPVPSFPETIAIITSPTGAAVRDMIQTIRRRYPLGKIILIPAVVQGERGAASLVQAIEAAHETHADVILLGRGGGSLEDLWNFNEELVVRAVSAATIPIVSGIGHETDITLVDFVSDYRASTPTGAAETVTPYTLDAIEASLDEAERQLGVGLRHLVQSKQQLLDDLSNQLASSIQQAVRQQVHQLDVLATQLNGLDVSQILAQGYTLTLKDGKRITQAEALSLDDLIETRFADGKVISRVEKN